MSIDAGCGINDLLGRYTCTGIRSGRIEFIEEDKGCYRPSFPPQTDANFKISVALSGFASILPVYHNPSTRIKLVVLLQRANAAAGPPPAAFLFLMLKLPLSDF